MLIRSRPSPPLVAWTNAKPFGLRLAHRAERSHRPRRRRARAARRARRLARLIAAGDLVGEIDRAALGVHEALRGTRRARARTSSSTRVDLALADRAAGGVEHALLEVRDRVGRLEDQIDRAGAHRVDRVVVRAARRHRDDHRRRRRLLDRADRRRCRRAATGVSMSTSATEKNWRSTSCERGARRRRRT